MWGKSSPQLWSSESQLTAAVLDKRQKAAWKEATWEVSFWSPPQHRAFFLPILGIFRRWGWLWPDPHMPHVPGVELRQFASVVNVWENTRVHLALESRFDRVESSEVMRSKRWLRLVASAAWLKRIETSNSQESQDPNKRHWTMPLIVVFFGFLHVIIVQMYNDKPSHYMDGSPWSMLLWGPCHEAGTSDCQLLPTQNLETINSKDLISNLCCTML